MLKLRNVGTIGECSLENLSSAETTYYSFQNWTKTSVILTILFTSANMDLPNIVMGLLNDSETKKTLVTVAADGKTNLTNVKAIKLLKPSVIVLAQAAAKQLNKELLAHMDNGRLVSILCVAIKEEQRTAFQIVCSVREFQTSGPLYEKFLDELRARYLDLDGVWVLEPVDIVDRSSNFNSGESAK